MDNYNLIPCHAKRHVKWSTSEKSGTFDTNIQYYCINKPNTNMITIYKDINRSIEYVVRMNKHRFKNFFSID